MKQTLLVGIAAGFGLWSGSTVSMAEPYVVAPTITCAYDECTEYPHSPPEGTRGGVVDPRPEETKPHVGGGGGGGGGGSSGSAAKANAKAKAKAEAKNNDEAKAKAADPAPSFANCAVPIETAANGTVLVCAAAGPVKCDPGFAVARVMNRLTGERGTACVPAGRPFSLIEVVGRAWAWITEKADEGLTPEEKECRHGGHNELCPQIDIAGPRA